MDPLTIGAIGGVLGGVGGLISGNASKKAANAQRKIADQQAQMFGRVQPTYLDALNALRGHAGMPQMNWNATATQQVPMRGLMGTLGHTQGVQVNQPQAMPGQTQGQGTNPYNFPEDKLRMLQAYGNIGRNTQRSQDQLSFGLGRRGLTGSSMDVAGRAALLQGADRDRAGFERQQAINAPLEYERRLGLLMNALNPGLGAGASAGSMFGQQAGMYGDQAAQAFGGLGNSIQNYMQYDQMQRMLKQQQMAQTQAIQQAFPFGMSAW